MTQQSYETLDGDSTGSAAEILLLFLNSRHLPFAVTFLSCNCTANFIKCINGLISLKLNQHSFLTYLNWAYFKPLATLSSAGNPAAAALENLRHILKWGTIREDIVFLKFFFFLNAFRAFQSIFRDLIGNSITPNVGRDEKINLCSENMQRHFLWVLSALS